MSDEDSQDQLERSGFVKLTGECLIPVRTGNSFSSKQVGAGVLGPKCGNLGARLKVPLCTPRTDFSSLTAPPKHSLLLLWTATAVKENLLGRIRPRRKLVTEIL